MRWNWGRVIGLGLLVPVICLASEQVPATQPSKSDLARQAEIQRQLEQFRAQGLLGPRDIGALPHRVPTTVPSTKSEFFQEDSKKVPNSWRPFNFNGYTYYVIPCG